MRNTLQELLQHLDQRLLESSVRNSREELGQSPHENFTEFGSSGRIFNKMQIIEFLGDEPPVSRQLINFAVELFAPGVALVTYDVICHSGTENDTRTHRSSIWILADHRWQMRFHQGTVASN